MLRSLLIGGLALPLFCVQLHAAETEAWWVFFDERPAATRTAEIDAARQRLGERVLERRAKGSQRPLVGEIDRPLDPARVAAVESLGLVPRVESRWLNALSVVVDEAGRKALLALDGVRELRPVARGERRPLPDEGPPPDPRDGERVEYGESLGQLEMLRVPEAHDLGLTGAGVRVLMLDTGYFKGHVAIDTTRIVAEWDFINDDGQTQNEPGDLDDQHSHGTATVTAMGGRWPGHLVGPAYGSEWLLAKTEDVSDETPVEEDYYVAALEWGEALGADVASASLGYTDWYEFEDLDGQTAVCTIGVNQAVALGVTVVVSAGNARQNDWGHINTPADAFDVISVGAVDSDEDLAGFSSPGPSFDGRMKPEVSAQGVGVYCAGIDAVDHLRTASGTSLSCPLVAGCAALLIEQHPDWGPLDVRAALMETADRAGDPDNDFGWGVIDVMAALDWQPPSLPVPAVAIAWTGGQLRLSWSDVGADMHHVEWSAAPYGPFETRLASVPGLEWSDPDALARGDGWYRVVAERP